MKKRIVIKLGGASLQNGATLHQLTLLVAGYRTQGYDIVVVHGGGPAINQELTARGIEWKFINGQRQTTAQMIGVIESVLAGKINAEVVQTLNAAGIQAAGLSGATADTLLCTQVNAELQQVGEVQKVNVQHIESLLALGGGTVVVLAPIGIGAEGEKYNINADWAAAKTAIALKAERLVFLTDQAGVLGANKQVVPQLTATVAEKLIADGTISGGMYTKVMTMLNAVQRGVGSVCVLNATAATTLLSTDFKGTTVLNEVARMSSDELKAAFLTN
ncbi:MAG: acetylglutamate kinase [Bdellovibrionaceae bacterium]|nr:acetylglutamate kinase [Pseudobdellovibrionaceae bacterium]